MTEIHFRSSHSVHVLGTLVWLPVCSACGVAVVAGQQDKHRAWHQGQQEALDEIVEWIRRQESSLPLVDYLQRTRMTVRCSQCHRMGSDSEAGLRCGMTQPDGKSCEGVFHAIEEGR